MPSEELIKRIPPHSSEAEKACLGAMMQSDQAVNIVLEMLKAEDFYDEKNRIIFQVISGLRDESAPIDEVSVIDRLNVQGNLNRIGGAPYLSQLADSVPAAASVEYYCKVVVEKSVLRQLIQASYRIVDNVYEYQSDVERLTEEAEKLIFDITGRRIKGDYQLIKDIITQTLLGVERFSSSGHIYTGLPTHYRDFDDMTNGFPNGSLVVLAARPSMGKTAFALNIANNVAKPRTEEAVLFFSLEMSDQELALRMLASESRVSLKKIRSGQLKQNDWDSITSAAGILSESKLLIDDTPAISITELRSKARRVASRYKLKLIVIDHLQIVTAGDPTKPSYNRVQEISFISRSLKALAKELDLPVLVLSQLSRSVENRTDKRPILSDLRESGAIEQDADIVGFLYRDEYYNRENSKEPNVAELILAKQRNGPTGTIKLRFNSELVRFDSLESPYRESAVPNESDFYPS